MEALQLLPLLLSDPLGFSVHLHIRGLQEVPVDLHEVSTSASAAQPTGAPAPLTSPEPETNPFPSLCVLEALAMAPGSIASPKQCQEGEAPLRLRVNLLEAEDGEKNLLPWEAHPADSYWLMLEDMMEERTQPRRTPLL